MRYHDSRGSVGRRCSVAFVLFLTGLAAPLWGWQADGTQLPKPDPKFDGVIGESYRDSKPSYPLPVTARP